MSDTSPSLMSTPKRLLALVGLAVVLLGGGYAVKLWVTPTDEPGSVDVQTVIRRLRQKYRRGGFVVDVELPRARKVIDKFPLANAVEAHIEPDELIVGISIDGESRAYPLNMLTGPTREVINDTLGKQPIVVTWCSLCYHAMVFSAEVAGEKLTFSVSGSLHHQNLVLTDVQTNSMWVQLSGQCEFGSYKGHSLRRLPCSVETWASWKRAHPDSTAMNWTRSENSYKRGQDHGAGELVFVMERDDRRLSVPLSELTRDTVIHRRLNHSHIVVVFDADSTLIVAFVSAVELKLALEGKFLVAKGTGKRWHWRTGNSADNGSDDLEPVAGWVTTRRAIKAIYRD